MALLGVTDVDVFGRNFYGARPFDFGTLLADLWPRSILKALTITAAFVALSSEWFSNNLGKLRLSGSALILILFLGVVVAYAIVIGTNQLYYPLPSDENSPMLVMTLGMAFALFPLVAFTLNLSFAKPAPAFLIIGLSVLLFAAVKIWSEYAFTGNIDFTSPVTMYFDD